MENSVFGAFCVFWVKIVISDGKLGFRCILRVLGENRDFRWKTRFSVHSACVTTVCSGFRLVGSGFCLLRVVAAAGAAAFAIQAAYFWERGRVLMGLWARSGRIHASAWSFLGVRLVVYFGVFWRSPGSIHPSKC